MLDSQLKSFIAIVECGSLQAAARQLHLSPSAVSKQLSRLEERLGVQLILRSTRSLQVTPTGEVFYTRCLAISQALDSAVTEIHDRSGDPSGVLKITLPEVLVNSALAVMLKHFTETYPAISLDVQVSNDLHNLIGKNFDLGFRVGPLPDSSLIGVPLFQSRIVLCASPAYVEQHGPLAKVEDLQGHRILAPSPAYLTPSVEVEGASAPALAPGSYFYCDSIPLLLGLVARGAGLALLWDYSIQEDVARGELVAFDCPIPHSPRSVSLVYPSRDYLPRPVRLFIDHSSQHFRT